MYVQSTLHNIDWDAATVLQCEQKRTRRKIKKRPYTSEPHGSGNALGCHLG